jgi:hypothetical protein
MSFIEDCKDDYLKFNEASLNKFLQDFAGRYSYIVQKQKEMKEDYDRLYNLKFVEYKDGDGGSDKLCEARCKADQILSDMKKEYEKYSGFIKAMDYSYNSAISYGHNLRKEMEKVDSDVHFSRGYGYTGPPNLLLDQKVDEIVGSID